MFILAAVILGFSSLSGTTPQIYTPKRYDEHPRHFIGKYTTPLPPPAPPEGSRCMGLLIGNWR